MRENLRGQTCLGSDEFFEQHVPADSTTLEIPRAQRPATRPPLPAIVSSSEDAPGIARAYIEHRYIQHEIADHLGVHYSTVSRRVRAVESRRFRNTMCDCKI